MSDVKIGVLPIHNHPCKNPWVIQRDRRPSAKQQCMNWLNSWVLGEPGSKRGKQRPPLCCMAFLMWDDETPCATNARVKWFSLVPKQLSRKQKPYRKKRGCCSITEKLRCVFFQLSKRKKPTSCNNCRV